MEKEYILIIVKTLFQDGGRLVKNMEKELMLTKTLEPE